MMKNELKQTIAKTLNNNLSIEDAIKDFIDLRNIDLNTTSALSQKGLKFINFFTMIERLDTKGIKKLSFFEFIDNFQEEMKKPYYKKVYDYLCKTRPNLDFYKIAKLIFSFSFGSLNAFRPIISMNIYQKFKPKSVLNPFSGWGGFVVGAAALDVPQIIAIDSNSNLFVPYTEMKETLSKLSSSNIEFIISDFFSVNLNKIKYDMVIMSPPYYTKEIYNNQPHIYRSKKDWNNNFYRPLFKSCYNGLERNGVMAINVPHEIYKSCLVPLFGSAKEFIPLSKYNKNNKYKELIYIYFKDS